MRSIYIGVLAIGLAGCVTGAITGEVRSNDVRGYVAYVSGRSDTASTQVTYFALHDSNAPPQSGTYDLIGSTFTSATRASSADPYTWSLTTIPLSSTTASTTAQWLNGGLGRFKARSKFNGSSTPQDMYTFDTEGLTCLFANYGGSGTDWVGVGNTCRTPYSALDRVITTVSSLFTPYDQHESTMPYLSYRGHNGPENGKGAKVSPDGQAEAAATGDYYSATHAPETLVLFKEKYGFNLVPNNEVSLIYYNAGDLGVARDMHCRSFAIPVPFNVSTTGKACYVTNYGKLDIGATGKAAFGEDLVPAQTAISQALAPSGLGTHSPIATVAMVYTTPGVIDSDVNVQFAVYNSDGSNTSLAINAALDNNGVEALGNLTEPSHANVAIPSNCLSCHGSSSTYVPGQPVKGARFLPFDPQLLVFKVPSTAAETAQQMASIKSLNAIVWDTLPATGPGVKLLRGMYPVLPATVPPSGLGPKDATTSFDPNFVPDAWLTDSTIPAGNNTPKQVYNEVFKPYCRTCHVSHDVDGGGLDFSTFADFRGKSSFIGALTCDDGSGPMPQSEQTQRKFWRSPARAHLLNAFGIGGSCAPCKFGYDAGGQCICTPGGQVLAGDGTCCAANQVAGDGTCCWNGVANPTALPSLRVCNP